MSKLSDLLGVEEDRPFQFKEWSNIYRIHNGWRQTKYLNKDEWFDTSYEKSLVNMINNPELIKLLPLYSDEQITAFKGRIAEDTCWAVRNEFYSQLVNFYKSKPTKDENGMWNTIPPTVSSFPWSDSKLYDFVTKENSPVYLPDLLEED